MFKLMALVGYSSEENYKNKVVYPLALLSFGVGGLFWVLYILMVGYVPPIVVASFYMASSLYIIYLLKTRHYQKAKFLLVWGFIIQETLAVFVWYPVDTGFNLYYFLVPPTCFIIYNYDVKLERLMAIFYSSLAAVLYIVSEHMAQLSWVYLLPSETMQLFKSISMITTIFPIIYVFMLFSKELAKVQRELQLLANTDGLTRITNRRAMYVQGIQECRLAVKYNYDFSVVMIDLDYFKAINDQYGHLVGDQLLIQFTDIILANIRKVDTLARYGGEEFAIILRKTSGIEAKKIAEALRVLISETEFVISENLTVKLTFSAGVAQYYKNMRNFDELMKIVDDALYEAKEKGRNQTVLV